MKMADIVGGKRRLSKKTILEKYAALKSIDNGDNLAIKLPVQYLEIDSTDGIRNNGWD